MIQIGTCTTPNLQNPPPPKTPMNQERRYLPPITTRNLLFCGIFSPFILISFFLFSFFFSFCRLTVVLFREPRASDKINVVVENASWPTSPLSKSEYAHTKQTASKRTFNCKNSPKNSISKIKNSRKYVSRHWV